MNDPQTEETIFAASLELPPAERAVFLDQACGKDAALRQRLELLLNASEQSGRFLEESAAPSLRPTRVVTSALAEQHGDRIGRYKLLQQIGEGGCGVVYMAEQEKPVRRRVALKVIKLGMDTRQVIARFEAERQALALMEHPNIAKVLDVGATETGRPFFVMELVRGVKITEYCDQNNLPTRERLELFIQVCRAIQHAHQKGIIHRDIKPSNIIVTLHDGVPVPKVIDFGIAKATQGRLTDRTVFTAFEQFIGTPAYMSPEQAELSGLDIDTRSDIYSLGVLLYELLTGRTPFDSKELLAAGLEVMRRTIREKEPERPSTRLSTMLEGELSTAAFQRRSEVSKLVGAIRGDLDWIVMKCLEKDRTRRYETANGLTSEIQRHLNQEPVLACPPSRLYRFQKMVRRNKLAFSAGSLVVISLITGLTASTALLIKAKQQRDEAVKQKVRANEQASIAKAVEDFLQTDLLSQAGAWAQAAGGFEPEPDLTVKEALRRASATIGERFTSQPLVEAEIRQTLGAAFAAVGALQMAVPHFERALALHQRVLGPGDPRTIGSMRKLAGAYEGDKANQLLEETLKIAKSRLGPDHPETLKIMTQVAQRVRWSGRVADGTAMQEETLKLQRARLGPDDPDTLESMHWVAVVYMGSKRYQEEVQVREEILKLTKAKSGAGHPSTVWAMGMLAQAYWSVGRLREAVELAQEALSLAKSRSGSVYYNHPAVGWITGVLARTLAAQGKLGEAETAAREGVAMCRMLGAAKPGLAEALSLLAAVQQDAAKLPEAESTAREAVELHRKNHGEFSREAAVSLQDFGLLLFDERKFPEAETTFREELSICQKLGDTNNIAVTLKNLGSVLVTQAKFSEGELMQREALALFRKLEESEDIVGALLVLGQTLYSESKTDECEAIYREAVRLDKDECNNQAIALNNLLELLEDQRRLATEALALLDQLPKTANRSRLVLVRTWLASLMLKGKFDEAEKIFNDQVSQANGNGLKPDELPSIRGAVFARLGKWQEATANLTRAIDLNPDETGPWCSLAAIYVQTDQLEAYRELCRKAVERFNQTTNAGAAGGIANAFLWLPPSPADIEILGQMAESAVRRFPWFAFTKALAEYRQSHFSAAIFWTDRTASTEEEEAAAVLRAMSWHEMNQKEKARAALPRVIELAGKENQTRVKADDLGHDWVDWIHAQALLREARALIEGQPITPEDSGK